MAARPPVRTQLLFRCTESFTIFRDGVPDVYAAGLLVNGDEPILDTHGQYFEQASATFPRARSEVADADPGTPRTVTGEAKK